MSELTVLCSPAEPAEIRQAFTVSGLCETLGADFLLASPAGWVGIQRKEVRDLVASVRGDRIARELGQGSQLAQMVLIVEGDWRWQPSGQSLIVEGFTRPQYDGLMLAFQHEQWWVLHTPTIAETIATVHRAANWFAKEHHHSLRQRPNHRGVWGTASNRDWAIHLLQSFDGVGVELAGRIYDQLGVPLQWTVTEAGLLAVPGIGKKKAQAILAALDTGRILGSERGADDE
jgi:ERCC4-type nuclease